MIRTFQSLALFIMCLELSGCGFFRAIARGGVAVMEFGIIGLLVVLLIGFWIIMILFWLVAMISIGVQRSFGLPDGQSQELNDTVFYCCFGLLIAIGGVIAVFAF